MNMEYPNEKLTATSRYSYEEICATLDQWAKTEHCFTAILNAVPDYSALPADLKDKLTWLEPVSCPLDGIWHRAGNAEMFPVAKWKKLIKQHQKLAARIKSFI